MRPGSKNNRSRDSLTQVLYFDQSRLSDPDSWHVRADEFRAAVRILWHHSQQTISFEAIAALSTIPYLVATGAELYMKGYLVRKGIAPSKFSEKETYGHNLESLRLKCLEYGDKRLEHTDLCHLTETYGNFLTAKGGIRYPDKSSPVFEGWIDALDILSSILREEK